RRRGARDAGAIPGGAGRRQQRVQRRLRSRVPARPDVAGGDGGGAFPACPDRLLRAAPRRRLLRQAEARRAMRWSPPRRLRAAVLAALGILLAGCAAERGVSPRFYVLSAQAAGPAPAGGP